jgi:hypothetical protein
MIFEHSNKKNIKYITQIGKININLVDFSLFHPRQQQQQNQ